MRIAADDEWCWLCKIARFLSAPLGHDSFDWWSNIWLPAFLGLSTLALAGASVYVAFQSHRTSQRAANAAEQANEITQHYREEERRQKARQRRLRLVTPVQDDYFRNVFSATTGFADKAGAERRDKIKKLSLELDESDQFDALRGVLATSVRSLRERFSLGRREEGQWPDALFEEILDYNQLVEEWARDPEAVPRRRQSLARREALSRAFEERYGEREK